MKLPKRIPLNPCDYCIYGHHRFLRRQRSGGNNAFWMADLAGWIDPPVVRSALAAAMLAHPVTMSTLHTSLFRLRPFWRLPRHPSETAPIAAERAYLHDDLRMARNWSDVLDQRCSERCTPDSDPARGPQVRLEHYTLPGERTRLCIRWPHYLMDAEGAEWFLAELERQQRPEGASMPSTLRSDPRPVEVLSDTSCLERFRLMKSGLSHQTSHTLSGVRHLPAAVPSRFESYQILHRQWHAEDFARIRDAARRATPSGPGLYARHCAGAVIRALDRIYREERVETSAYSITFPMRVRHPGQPSGALFHRPLTGNYLVTPTLVIPRDRAGDPQSVGSEILRQHAEFLDRRQDAAQWALLQGISLVHPWFYPLIFRFSFAAGAYSSGFSYYVAKETPFRRLAGAEVVNFWGGSQTTTPPGWNPTFTRYGDGLNMGLTWMRPTISDDLARRYADYIEEFLFKPS